jgi:signal transduction histidine kinase
MLELILATGNQMGRSAILLWAIGALLVMGAVAMLFIQRRTGKNLEYELSELEKLKENNVESEFILKAMRLCTWHMDPSTGVIAFDSDFRDSVSSLVSLSETAPSTELRGMLVQEDAERVGKSLQDLCTGRSQEYHEEYRVMIPHTNKFFWEESYAIVSDRDLEGKPTRVVGTTMRIDDRKAMEEALVDARNKAEESDRLKTAFIANMSHEIRTPLNAIIGFTSLLPDIQGENERKELINLIQENNQKLLRIIDDVINISKIEAGKEELHRSTFDLNLILNDLIVKYTDKLSEKVIMNTQFAGTTQNVTTDLKRLQEAMDSLIANAVKFTENGSITVGYDEPHDGKILIWVKDTGKGIADDMQEHVFERFFKVDEFIPGAGLGLSICRTMAESIGGRTGVNSKLGEGSTFWIEIPIG